MTGASLAKASSVSAMRDGFLDTLRGFAILGVVCIHFGGSFATSANAWTPSFYVGLVLNQFFSFAVPLFVFISGLLASPYRASRKVKLGRYYLERIRAIGWPYLIASVAAFSLLGMRHELAQISTDGGRLQWLLSRFFYYGIHPTFYFIPMIILLYFLKPLLSWLAPAVHHYIGRIWGSTISLRATMWVTLAMLLAVHLLLGFFSKRGDLNFYVWCRPNPLFWAVYFYFGLVFPEVSKAVSSTKLEKWLLLSIVLIGVSYFFDWRMLTDIALVGVNFEHSGADYTYVNLPVVAVNLLVTLFVAGLLVLGVNRQNAILSLLGRHSLYIYLWHILLLFFLAWRNEAVMTAVKRAPELILGFSFFAAVVIAVSAQALGFVLGLPGRYSLELNFKKLNT